MKRDIKTHGQHFLRGQSFIAELVGHSTIRKNDMVLDIGAGSGAITDVLARRVTRVVAYEPEPIAAKKLRDNLARRQNVEIIEKDFLCANLPDVPYKVFSNIPFRLSSKIVRKLVTAKTPPTAIYLIVQKQFAQKMISTGTHFHGALGMAIAPWWVARIRRPLRKTDFTPPPAVDTVLLELKLRETPLVPPDRQTAYMAMVEGCYSDPRLYAKIGGPKDKKPSQLSLEEWVALAG
jgi:23S rRNA (adenine-N6)-dimethyltransferase